MLEERENELKKRINDKLTAEEEKFNLVNNKLNSQLCSILHFKKEKENVENLSGFEFLLKMADFYSELNSIDLNLPTINREITFQEMKKEEEIEYVRSVLSDLSTDKFTFHSVKTPIINIPATRCSSSINDYNKETKMMLMKSEKTKIPNNSLKESRHKKSCKKLFLN
jgi:hypothetical protein